MKIWLTCLKYKILSHQRLTLRQDTPRASENTASHTGLRVNVHQLHLAVVFQPGGVIHRIADRLVDVTVAPSVSVVPFHRV